MDNKGLLWKISGNNLKQSSYLFGTMHVKDQRVFGAFEKIKPYILACEAYASEFKLDDVQPTMNQNFAFLPKGKTLNDLLNDKQTKQVNDFLLQHLGIPLQQVNRHKPLILGNLITTSLFQENQTQSLDETLYKYAKDEGKSMTGIETYAEQLQILDKISLKKQVKFLISIMDDFGNHQEEVAKLTKLYQSQDIEKLYKLTKKNTKGLRRILLHDRNKTMAKRISKMIQQQSLFSAIGAGHLGGEKGVLNRLIRKGYLIEAI